MVSGTKLANAVRGRTTRACDGCLRNRARWYCPADDAFLCQSCDVSVHSANPLARRHERIRLKTSCLESSDESPLQNSVPSWHRGLTRRARTPRQGKHSIRRTLEETIQSLLSPVPELGSGGETSNEENEDQLLYRVPALDPFLAELCTSANSNQKATDFPDGADAVGSESKAVLPELVNRGSGLHGLLPSETELADFAADVETLLGTGLDEEPFDMDEALGILDCKDKDSLMEGGLDGGGGRVKVEDEEELSSGVVDHGDADMADMDREPFEFNFDCDSPVTHEEEERKLGDRGTVMEDSEEGKTGEAKKKKNNILLRLDYESIIASWANQRSPWTSGDRPELDACECWPDCMDGCGTVHNRYGDGGSMGGNMAAMGDGGREARVLRYREKRRTRLFSKKIRYEVRKLNAEKRPRMKGRFVKRTNFAGPVAAFPLLIAK
ncbi:hypothetical protein U1Q18_029565 [Sarracenia purpurea var. burkii]